LIDLSLPTQTLALADDAATVAAGAALLPLLQARRHGLLRLEGPLGAGKTTLMRGLLRALGVAGPIRSPTYTLVEPYEIGGLTVLHFDLYRLAHPAELYALGLEDQPPDRVWWCVEWPGRGAGILPPADLDIALGFDGSGRRMRLDLYFLANDSPRFTHK
jgi:tRNA threonylcarbamoyladenosine biosynthesis protein TsaE